MLVEARCRYDLSRFEYTRTVRIAPTKLPYSHPRLTLNSWVNNEIRLLMTYLHEQMHWCVTWFSYARLAGWGRLMQQLHQLYPKVPAGGPDGGDGEASAHLHLVVNWLEIEATAQFIDRGEVIRRAASLPFYRWPYRTVIDDADRLVALYRQEGLIPIRHATDVSDRNLRLAANPSEAAYTGSQSR